jgi:glycosyltransferase involved in cell wall biosynthesis
MQNLAGQKLEIIVVDDGSSDETSALALAWADLFRAPLKLIAQHNSGPAAARNAGVTVAHGEIIAFLDSDDEWLPGKLREQMRLMDSDSSIKLVCSPMNGKPFRTRKRKFDLSFSSLLFTNRVYTSSVLVRRQAFLASGGFDSSRRFSEDYELWLKITQFGRIVVLNKPLIHRSAGGVSSRLWEMERGELGTYRIVARERYISRFFSAILRFWSIGKFFARIGLRALRDLARKRN